MLFGVIHMRRKVTRELSKLDEFVKLMTVKDDKVEFKVMVEEGVIDIYEAPSQHGYEMVVDFTPRIRTTRYTLLIPPKIPLTLDIETSSIKSIFKSILRIFAKSIIKVRPVSSFRAPAYRVVDKEFKDIIVAILRPLESNSKGYLRVETSEGDFAETEFEIRGNIIRGVLKFRRFKARSARIEIIGELSTRRSGVLSGGKVEIVKTKDEIVEYNYPLSCSESIILVFHREFVDVWDIMDRVGLNAISGCGEGDYKLRLVLDIPHQLDVYEEISLRI
jgi:hypothetical protein